MGKGYKWWRMTILNKEQSLIKHLPVTRSFSKQNLFQLLSLFSSVIVKPSHGSGGLSIIKVSSVKDHRYQVQLNQTIQMTTEKQLYEKIKKWTLHRPYIVQQYISLARIQQRPFDVRVMVQKINGEWKVTGTLAKVAGRGYIVTNLARSKGYILPIKTAITRSTIQASSSNQIIVDLHQTALKAAQQLNKSNPNLRILGIDMGIDQQGKIWIIETNYSPAISLFKHLKDKKTYYTILKYKNG